MQSGLLFPFELQWGLLFGPEVEPGITSPRIVLVVAGSNLLNPWGSGHVDGFLPSWN